VEINIDEEIGKDVNNLVVILENCGIDYLLECMQCDEYVSSYIPQKQQETRTQSSTDNKLWYAYQRAQKINSPSDKIALLIKLKNENDIKKKDIIYYCLAHYCGNTNDVEVFNLLMDKLSIENKSIQQTIIGGLSNFKSSNDVNLNPVFKLVSSKSDLLKAKAISLLGNLKGKRTSEAELLIISIFNNANRNTFIKDICIYALAKIGTKDSLELLIKAFKKAPPSEYKSGIVDAIRTIKDRLSIPYDKFDPVKEPNKSKTEFNLSDEDIAEFKRLSQNIKL
jgi:hypothetical protein